MPPPRKVSARASQLQNAKLEEEVVRTRYGRSIKATPTKAEAAVPQKTSPIQINGLLNAKRTGRKNSHVSAPPAARGIYAEVKPPQLLVIYGLPRQVLEDIAEQEKDNQRNARKDRLHTGQFTQSDLDNDTSTDDNEFLNPPPVAATRGRGRGGRGRGGRGRGSGRGRGRGGAGSGVNSQPRTISPLRERKARNAAPTFPLTEADDEDSANHESAADDAKDLQRSVEDLPMINAEEIEDGDDAEQMDDVQFQSNTPPGSPPEEQELGRKVAEALKPPPSAIAPIITVDRGSASQTPAITAAPSPVAQLVDPEDDILSDSDLPRPWVEDYDPPTNEEECEDRADFLLQTRFKPMTDVDQIVASLTKFAPSQRSTENLYLLAENTQKILKAWQDEYLQLDKKTAPHAHPPKKPANGGRVPVNPLVFEGMKEADLYGYVYDGRKGPDGQDPYTQRIGAEKSRGRELRQRRRDRDMFDSAAPSEEEGGGDEGTGPGRRQRRATRRFDSGEQTTGTNTPQKKNNGWGGARKRGVSKYAQDASATVTPEPEARPAKRAKVSGPSLVHHRIQEMREESVATSSADEGSGQDAAETQQSNEKPHKRGRPAGSKNTGRRSDFGVKKGPRKKNAEGATPIITTQTSSAPPPVLQSLSDGQNQFSIDPQPPTVSQLGPHGVASAPPMMAQPVSTVFQATPQPPGMPDPGLPPPPAADPSPDAYMSTAGLSQYTQPYPDDAPISPASASKGGQKGGEKKQRVKSEKRSHSMTVWWAERKARQQEENKLNPNSNAESSKSSTPKPSSRGRGSRPSSSNRPEPIQSPYPPTDQMHHHEQYPNPPPPHHMHAHPPPPPHMEYLQGPPPPMPHQQHQHQQMLMQNSGLAAMPSGLMQHGMQHPGPMQQGPMQHQHPGPISQAPMQPGPPPGPHMPRSSMPALAPAPPMQPQMPAPMPSQLPSYPSPYGPRPPRQKSNGPQPLAPAPLAPAPTQHISPYGPPHPMGQGPMGQNHMGQHHNHMSHGPMGRRTSPPRVTALPPLDMQFKVLVPGPPPGEVERRG